MKKSNASTDYTDDHRLKANSGEDGVNLRNRRKKMVLSGVLLAVLLGGCSLAPSYQRPAAPVPAAWPYSVKSAGERSLPDWQSYYSDPRLQALIAAALENNRDLRIATARIDEARAQYGIQQADRLPNVNLNASRTASLSPASTSFTGRPFGAQRYDVNASLVSFEIDFWGRVASLNAAAKASYLATEAAQRGIDRAVHLPGGLGVTLGVKVEELYREIRALRIY